MADTFLVQINLELIEHNFNEADDRKWTVPQVKEWLKA